MPPRRKGVKGERKLRWMGRGNRELSRSQGPGPSPGRKGCGFPWPRASLHTPIFGFGWNELSPCQSGLCCGLLGLDLLTVLTSLHAELTQPGLGGQTKENSCPSFPLAFTESAWSGGGGFESCEGTPATRAELSGLMIPNLPAHIMSRRTVGGVEALPRVVSLRSSLLL